MKRYAIRTTNDYLNDYEYFSVECNDIVFGSKRYAYVFKKRHAKKVLKMLRALYPNDEFEIVKIL